MQSALKTSNPAAIVAALRSVAALRLVDLAPVVRELMTARHEDVSGEALKCVGALKDLHAVPALVELLEDERDPERRDLVAVTLRKVTGRTYGFDTAAWRSYVADKRL